MGKRVSKILQILLPISLAGLLLWYSFKGVNWAEFQAQIRQCRWGFVFLSMMAGAMAFVLRGMRWRRILEPLDPSIGILPCINGVNISNGVNLVIPYCGELVRCGVITRHGARDPETRRLKASYDQVLGTALLERSWDVLSVAILLFVLLLFKWQEFGAFMIDRIWIPVRDGMLGSRGWIVLGVVLLLVGSVVLVYRERNRNRVCRRICDAIRRFLQGFGSCLKMKHKGIFFLYTGLIWAMYWMQMVLIRSALPAVSGLGVLDCLFLMLVGSFASCLPVPGGFGTFHYIVSMALFAIYGYPQESVGILFATLAHESQSVMMLITAGASCLQEAFSRRGR